MKNNSYARILRDREIYQQYTILSQEGMSKMCIYVTLEDMFNLEERQIRRILKGYEAFQRQWDISTTAAMQINPQNVVSTQATNAFLTFSHSCTMGHLNASDTCQRSTCSCPFGKCSKLPNAEDTDSSQP